MLFPDTHTRTLGFVIFIKNISPRHHIMSGQIARLTTVAHVLYEREVLELRQENERLHQENKALKLELFWKKHDIRTLQSNIMALRMHYRAIRPRLGNDQDEWTKHVAPIIQSYGLEVEIVDQEGLGQPLSDLNVHFVCTGKFLITSYGAKLWKAKSVDDPELWKLKALFDAFTGPNQTLNHV